MITFMIFNSALVNNNDNHSYETVGTDLRDWSKGYINCRVAY